MAVTVSQDTVRLLLSVQGRTGDAEESPQPSGRGQGDQSVILLSDRTTSGRACHWLLRQAARARWDL